MLLSFRVLKEYQTFEPLHTCCVRATLQACLTAKTLALCMCCIITANKNCLKDILRRLLTRVSSVKTTADIKNTVIGDVFYNVCCCYV